ncbi:hypothetical protein VNO77_23688 [Canavalia gladiata]|uniref:Uncharacterized protein n=1 Tax=Canavalia gladiata TaxID=3824 RepID=A0AAN9L880_CANGL
MEVEMPCGHYEGPGYVSNWSIQSNTMRRRRRTSAGPPYTAVSGYGTYLKRTEPEMKRRCMGKDKSYEMEKEMKGSMRRRIQRVMKNKYGKMTHNC